jgi:hypothetical protein
VSVSTSVVLALGFTVVLAVLHLLAPRIRSLPLVPEAASGSFAGGLAVAYVFLHLLPEVAAGNEGVAEALGETVQQSPLLELGVFLVALTGFTLFYGLERLADRHHPRGGEGRGSNALLYGVHLGAFAGYNALITYTLPLRARTGLLFAVLFTVAIGLHFVLTDRGLQEHYGDRFRHGGRFVLAGALGAGWALAALSAPTSTVEVSLLTALIGGTTLLNVFKEELPDARRSHFGWFLAGLVLYAVLLLAVTVAEG